MLLARAALSVFAAAGLLAGVAQAQTPVPTMPNVDPHTAGPRDFGLVVLPIPISDPAIGNGLALTAIGLYKVGASERPWGTGVAAFYTDTESYGGAVFQRMSLDDEKFRVLGAIGGGLLNIKFFGIGQDAGARGISIPLEQKALGAIVHGQMRVRPELYIGVQYRLIDMSSSLHIENLPFPDLDLPGIELESRTGALGPTLEYDSRDDEFQPGKGLYIQGDLLFADKAFGGDFHYPRAELKVNGYHRVDPKSVVAWRASTCWAGDGSPFYDICNFGQQSDLRGYVSGQYRDRAMGAVQAEYRRHLFGRFGAVVFAGVGEVAESFVRFTADDVLPSAGAGLRIQASRKYKVNIGIDYGWGKDTSALLFHVGEAF